ncbi:glycosyltransferase family 61 protein [Gluconacetobacter sp. Hr-1-5]|uniref:glycosyltransferase family 61 protein n=1 Tax=Gluconacetobacter sp. Hr-1-5 TaxID=3395370 RepID=UPI003B52C9FE
MTEKNGWFDIHFHTTDRLEDFGYLPDPHKISYGPPLLSAPTPAILNEDAIGNRTIVDGHHRRESVPGIEYYCLPGKNFTLGSAGFIRNNTNDIFSNSNIYSTFVSGAIIDSLPESWRGSIFKKNAESVFHDEPIVILINYPFVYGHVLLEMFPKIYAYARLQEMGIRFKVAIPISIPGWMHDFVSMFIKTKDIIYYDHENVVMEARSFIMISTLNRGYIFHPEMNCFVGEAIRKIRTIPQKEENTKIYLSRRLARVSERGVENEEALEYFYSGIGYQIIYPEQLTQKEQIYIFSRATRIAGLFGSGLHNTIFSPRSAKVLCIGWLNAIQSYISNLRGHTIAYYLNDTEHGTTIDVRHIEDITCQYLS